jgi:hypothetical protein
VDLTLRSGLSLEEALYQAHQLDQSRREAGFDQQALDAAARMGLINGAFEDSEEDSHLVLEEFYPEQSVAESAPATTTQKPTPQYSSRRSRNGKPTLHDLILERTHNLQQANPPASA